MRKLFRGTADCSPPSAFRLSPCRRSLPVACIWYLHSRHYEPVTHDSTMTNRKSLAAIQKPCERLTTQNGLSPAVDSQGKYQRSPTDPEGRSPSVPKTSTKSAQSLTNCVTSADKETGENINPSCLVAICYLSTCPTCISACFWLQIYIISTKYTDEMWLWETAQR